MLNLPTWSHCTAKVGTTAVIDSRLPKGRAQNWRRHGWAPGAGGSYSREAETKGVGWDLTATFCCSFQKRRCSVMWPPCNSSVPAPPGCSLWLCTTRRLSLPRVLIWGVRQTFLNIFSHTCYSENYKLIFLSCSFELGKLQLDIFVKDFLRPYIPETLQKKNYIQQAHLHNRGDF